MFLSPHLISRPHLKWRWEIVGAFAGIEKFPSAPTVWLLSVVHGPACWANPGSLLERNAEPYASLQTY